MSTVNKKVIYTSRRLRMKLACLFNEDACFLQQVPNLIDCFSLYFLYLFFRCFYIPLKHVH